MQLPAVRRRSVLGYAVFAVAAAMALSFAGCTKITPRAGTGLQSGNAWTIHGVLRIGDNRVPDNLNRMLGTLTADTELSAFWCAHLLFYDDRERLIPELALAEPTLHNGGISADGRTIRYRLRHGVTWQDGAPFTASDVVFSWQQVMNPNNLVQSRNNYDQVRSIDTPDAYTIVVHLKQPWAPFISDFFANYCMLPKHLLSKYSSLNHADYNRLPIGTGPFRVAEYEPGTFIKFIANQHYWRGPPKLSEIDYHIVPSATTLLTQIRTHEIDFYHLASPEQDAQLHSIRGTLVYRYPFSTFNDIGFNAGHAALADRRVRQALAYATDVPALIANATHGVFLRANGDQPPWRWSFANDAAPYGYDPQKARSLLDAAGWKVAENGLRSKDGQQLQLTIVGSVGNAEDLATEELLQQQWRSVGVDLTIKNYPNNVLYALGSGIEQSGRFDVIFEGWTESGDPDNYQLYGCDMAPPHGWNVYHYCSTALDRAQQLARSSYDRAVRKQAYAASQKILREDLPFYVLWFAREQDLVNSDLRGYRPGRTNSAYWNVWEWSL